MANRLSISLVSHLVRLFCQAEYARFQRQTAQPQAAQSQVLKQVIRDLARTEYGKTCGIGGAEDYTLFAERLPIHCYEDMQQNIERQLLTERPVLTPHKVIHVEPTSGSSGPLKRIPYTRPLMASFTNMFQIWAYDLLRHCYEPKTGRMFMSVSPGSADGRFASDEEYLSQPLRSLISPFLLLPPKTTQSPQQFHQSLAIALLAAEDLEVISIWSPSYLLALMAHIDAHREGLAAVLSGRRRSRLATDRPIDWQALWPNLKLISCWDSAFAAPLAAQLRTCFPDVLVQGKGLLATEAPITVPLSEAGGCVPLVGSVFLEFQCEDGTIRRLHELEQGRQYNVIVTQRAGLTRYRLGDTVAVNGVYNNTPMINFIGRTEQTCDMVGEKLHEQFVRTALSTLIPSGRYVLIPNRQGRQRHYTLLVEQYRQGLASAADATLCQAFHYNHARNTGQLATLDIVTAPNVLHVVQTFHQNEGMRLGDIKESALVTDLHKADRLLQLADQQLAVGAVKAK